MAQHRWFRAGCGLLLAGSLALNGYLWGELRSLRRGVSSRDASTAEKCPAPQAEASPEAREEHLAKILGAFARAKTATSSSSPSRQGSSEADNAAQLLCGIARSQAEGCWRFFREDVLHLLRLYLADPGFEGRATVQKAMEIQKILGLGAEEGRKFLEEYTPVRRARVEEVRRLLEQDEVDWGGVLEQIRALQAEEDALVLRRFGEEQARKLQESLTEERLLLRLVFATYAERPWEEAVR